MRFSFVHAADVHLDTPFEGLSQTSPKLGSFLREASLRAFDNLITETISRSSSFLLLAGDIYDGEKHGIRAQLRFLKGMERLQQAGIQVFIVNGNHDPHKGWTAIRSWPSNVKVFSAESVERIGFPNSDNAFAHIYGRSFGEREVSENLALGFLRAPLPGFHIGLLHASVGSHEEHASYSPCAMSDLEQSGMHYWALGHIHKREVLKSSDPCVVYSGSLQGRSLKPSEQGEKGAMFVTVNGEQIEDLSFIECDEVRFCTLGLDIGRLEDVPQLEQAILTGLKQERTRHGEKPLVVRVHLKGRGVLFESLKDEASLQGLLKHFREEFEEVEPLVWFDSIRNDTRPDLELQRIRERGDLSSEVIRMRDQLLAEPTLFASFAEQALREADRPKVRKWFDVAAHSANRDSVLDEALLMLLDELEGEQ